MVEHLTLDREVMGSGSTGGTWCVLERGTFNPHTTGKYPGSG